MLWKDANETPSAGMLDVKRGHCAEGGRNRVASEPVKGLALELLQDEEMSRCFHTPEEVAVLESDWLNSSGLDAGLISYHEL
jgi:hypothetical protein